MKKDIHPENYRLVVFKDISCDYAFLTKSTVPTKETILWEDGKEYPLYKLEISDQSHPFYTGKMKLVDTAGRVDKFKSKYKKHLKKKEQPVAETKEQPAVETKEQPATDTEEQPADGTDDNPDKN